MSYGAITHICVYILTCLLDKVKRHTKLESWNHLVTTRPWLRLFRSPTIGNKALWTYMSGVPIDAIVSALQAVDILDVSLSTCNFLKGATHWQHHALVCSISWVSHLITLQHYHPLISSEPVGSATLCFWDILISLDQEVMSSFSHARVPLSSGLGGADMEVKLDVR